MSGAGVELRRHRRQAARRRWFVAALAVACLLAGVAGVVIGPSGIPLHDLFAALTGGDVARPVQVILWQLRLPVAATALIAGASLGLAGAEMQTVLGNPLAEPFTLGVSSTAALGAALAIVAGWALPGLPPLWAVPVNAFACAFGTLMLLQLLARWRGVGAESLILFGIGLGLTANAMLSMLQFVASADALQQLVFWTMGSLTRATWPSVAVMAAVLAIAAPWSLTRAAGLTALRLGEDSARASGIDVDRLRLGALLRISLLAAVAVGFCGVIGFVGLIGPHIARLCVGEDHRVFLPASLLTGALMLSLASLLASVILPGVVVPIGIVTALVGLPVFFALILRRG